MKILLSAYACEPHKGSELGLGWNWTKQIARFHNVWVITRANNREVIEDELNKNPNPNLHFYYLDLPQWMRFWKRGSRGLYLYYWLWQIAAYLAARRLHNQIKFDLAHHVTFGNNWRPSLISLLPIPFIWGPVGSEDMPKALISELGLKDKIFELLRFLIRRWGHYFNPFVKITIRRSKIIIDCNSKWTKNPLPQKHHHKLVKMSQNAINVNEYIRKYTKVKNDNLAPDKFTVLLCARLIRWKGVTLGCKAFVKFYKNIKKGNMLIIGDGPEKKSLINIFKKNELLNRVTFLGQLPMEEFLKNLDKGDVFLYPCFHHGQATVVLQAMAKGLPILCLDCDAIGETVTEECGIKVKLSDPEQVVHDLAYAIELLAKDKELRRRLGEGARKRVEQIYNWDIKGEQINQIYQKIFNRR